MDLAIVALIVLLVFATVVAMVLVYRITKLRSVGTPCLLRRIPATADAGWRHGVCSTTRTACRSTGSAPLRLGTTSTLLRQTTGICARRRPIGSEADILDGLVVLELEPGADGNGGAYELAMSQGAATAFQSCGSRPGSRRVRNDAEPEERRQKNGAAPRTRSGPYPVPARYPFHIAVTVWRMGGDPGQEQ